jgi:hypothetical protein
MNFDAQLMQGNDFVKYIHYTSIVGWEWNIE